jgi:hypothetical protein
LKGADSLKNRGGSAVWRGGTGCDVSGDCGVRSRFPTSIVDSFLFFLLLFFSGKAVRGPPLFSSFRRRLTCSIINKQPMAVTKAMVPSAMPTFAPTLMPEDDFELGEAVALGDDVELEGMKYTVDNVPGAISKGTEVVDNEGLGVAADVVEIIEVSEDIDEEDGVVDGVVGADVGVAPGVTIVRTIVVVMNSELSCLGITAGASARRLLILGFTPESCLLAITACPGSSMATQKSSIKLKPLHIISRSSEKWDKSLTQDSKISFQRLYPDCL